MSLLQTKLSISFLLIIGMSGAFAAPGDRDAERSLRQQNDRGDYQSENRNAQNRRSSESGQSEMDRGASGQSGNGAEGGRRQGRMSPEERRALRQQINEAGQDIYYRKP